MATEVQVNELPDCQLHDQCTAEYDMRMPGGRWAYICEDAYRGLGSPMLGTGRGQRLVVADPAPSTSQA